MTDELAPWRRLGELLIARRAQLGYGGKGRARFVRDKGFKNDRVLSDLENGIRANYDRGTLAQVEQAYGWVTGSIRIVLDGGDPHVMAELGPREPVEGDTSAESSSVSADPDDASYVEDDTGDPAVALISDEELADRIRAGLEAMDEMRRRTERSARPLDGAP